jgi:hypothetical protein
VTWISFEKIIVVSILIYVTSLEFYGNEPKREGNKYPAFCKRGSLFSELMNHANLLRRENAGFL